MTVVERAARAMATLRGDVLHLHGASGEWPADWAAKHWQDFVPAARAVLTAIREDVEGRQNGADWAAEYGESAEAAIDGSDLAAVAAYIDAALEER